MCTQGVCFIGEDISTLDQGKQTYPIDLLHHSKCLIEVISISLTAIRDWTICTTNPDKEQRMVLSIPQEDFCGLWWNLNMEADLGQGVRLGHRHLTVCHMCHKCTRTL